MCIREEAVKQKAFRIINDLKGFDVVEEYVETGGGAMADTFYSSYAISFKPKNIKETIKYLHNLDTPIISKIKKDYVLLYVLTIEERDIEYVYNVLKHIEKEYL